MQTVNLSKLSIYVNDNFYAVKDNVSNEFIFHVLNNGRYLSNRQIGFLCSLVISGNYEKPFKIVQESISYIEDGSTAQSYSFLQDGKWLLTINLNSSYGFETQKIVMDELTSLVNG